MKHSAFALVRVVVRGGVEPPTFRFSGGRSYRLSYLTSTTARQGLTAAVLTGFEPATSTLTGWRALHAALQDHRKAIAFARMRIPPSSTWLSPRFRPPLGGWPRPLEIRSDLFYFYNYYSKYRARLVWAASVV